ncbi:hypothetical protein [Anaerorhabdus sp.]|uniref:hypothetical protein n=1 Tax=Anaerorhabdus sp. TaxID=1872524 RepID=UPI002B1F4292|nr:hypothetical protein [Anaerorhabdus sp.]MEA4876101.1 hypothetical protein [Anaerorhabdus sp.]
MFGRVFCVGKNTPFPPGYKFKTGVLCKNTIQSGTSSLEIPANKNIIPLVIEGTTLSGGTNSCRMYDNNGKNYWGVDAYNGISTGMWSRYSQHIWIPGIYNYNWDLMKAIKTITYTPGVNWYNNDFKVTAWLEKVGN